MQEIISLILAVAILIVVVLILLNRNQERFIFYPVSLPKDHKFSFPFPFREMNFYPRKKIRINAVLINAENSRGLILYFHGNSGNIQRWGDEVAHDFVSRGYDLLLYDYRGFGKSSGEIQNEFALYKDARYIYKQMLGQYSASDIIFYGRSLGTGIAARLASKKNPRLLILETPYFNFDDVVKHHYNYLPVSLILKYRFPTNRFLKKVECPVFLIHGTEDKIIPYHSSVRLQKVRDGISLITLDGGMHNELNSFTQYQEALDRILK